MIRVQIYITEQERNSLKRLTKDLEKSQSELIREAIDQFIAKTVHEKKKKLSALKASKGMWKNRKDLPNFKLIRAEFDKRHNEK